LESSGRGDRGNRRIRDGKEKGKGREEKKKRKVEEGRRKYQMG
jgi:hypothetical protein